MTVYWIDSSVLIQCHQKYHPYKLRPTFWSWFAGQLDKGTVKMPHRAYREITEDRDDWLAKWCRTNQGRGLDIAASPEVQKKYREIAADVRLRKRHVEHQLMEFLKGADGWVIAYAAVLGGVVVSEEDKARKNETDIIKIPDECREHSPKIKWTDTFGMLNVLEAKF